MLISIGEPPAASMGTCAATLSSWFRAQPPWGDTTDGDITLAAGETVTGYQAVPFKELARQGSYLGRLPEMKKKLADLTKIMRDLSPSEKTDSSSEE